MNLRKVLSAMLIMLIGMNAQSQENKLSRIKVKVPASTQERLNLIASLELDHFIEEDGYITTEIGNIEMSSLRTSGYSYQVLVDDVSADLQEKNRPFFEALSRGEINIDGSPKHPGVQSRVAWEQPKGLLDNIIITPSAFTVQPTLGGYYSYAQMVTAVENLYNTYSGSGLVDTFQIGRSHENRMIYVVKISDNASSDEANEPEVFFQGVQHAREAIGGSSMIFLMQYLCQQYATDTRVKALVDNREIYIIVCMNPDGWEYNRSTDPSGGGGWRKNRRPASPSSNIGVDLNRNWDADWANCTGAVGAASCGSNTPSSGTYWGPSVFSEPEARAVRDFIQSKHIVVANDQHSVGPYYSLPFGRPGLHTSPDSLSISEQQWYTEIPSLMGKYNGMRAGNSVQALGYEVAGGIKDWFLIGNVGSGINGGYKGRILGMTGEGGYGAGASSFWPVASSIVTLCKGMTYQNLQMIASAGSYPRITDMSDIAIGVKAGNMDFRIKRVGVDDQPVTVTMIPIKNIAAGAPVTINSIPTYYGTSDNSVSFTLPGSISSGQIVQFAWKVETIGMTYYDTITKFYNPTVLFTDDMETGAVTSKWTVSGGWSYVSDSGYNATRALTESPGVKYTANSTRTATCNTVFNLTTAAAAYLTFRTKHKAENMRDKVQVQVFNGSTWTAVAGRTTVQEPGTNEGTTINGQPALTGIEPDWVNEVFDLSSFVGISNVQFRFVFTSNATATFYASEDGGFYMDDVKVITASNLSTLPVKFISFTGQMLPQNEVKLDWEATFDDQFSHYEVEKSASNGNFAQIERVEKNVAKTALDKHPFAGNNYYRIKAVDLNGDVTYSSVINIVNSKYTDIKVYPNPAIETVNLAIKLTEQQKIYVIIEDLAGRNVLTTSSTGGSTYRTVSLNVTGLPAQTYIIKIVNSKNEILSRQKFIKQ